MSDTEQLTTSEPADYMSFVHGAEPPAPVHVERQREGDGEGDNESDHVSLDPDKILHFGAKQIISLFIPVSLCMLLVVIIASTVKFYTSSNIFFVYTPFHTTGASTGTQIWQSLANAFIMIGVVAVMTVVLVLLFKYECYKLINGWLVVTTLLVLFIITLVCLTQVIQAMNIFTDFVSISFIMWNFGAMGLVTIHWKGPLYLQQSYLILISAQMALIFLKFLPPWTCWVLLGVLAIWDLIAVLCPRGPLRMLVELAQERDQPLFPALIYSTTAAYMMVRREEDPPANDPTTPPLMSSSSSAASSTQPVEGAGGSDTPASDSPQPQIVDSLRAREAVTALNGDSENVAVVPANTQSSANGRRGRVLREIQEDVMARDERGVKLGLGDFVFYSLLMGRATVDGEPSTILACYVSILIGMCLTILLLAIAGRALPALPISIAFGIIFYFVTSLIISPFTNSVAIHRIFI